MPLVHPPAEPSMEPPARSYGILECRLPECDWEHILRLLRATKQDYDAGLADFIENHVEEIH